MKEEGRVKGFRGCVYATLKIRRLPLRHVINILQCTYRKSADGSIIVALQHSRINNLASRAIDFLRGDEALKVVSRFHAITVFVFYAL